MLLPPSNLLVTTVLQSFPTIHIYTCVIVKVKTASNFPIGIQGLWRVQWRMQQRDLEPIVKVEFGKTINDALEFLAQVVVTVVVKVGRETLITEPVFLPLPALF